MRFLSNAMNNNSVNGANLGYFRAWAQLSKITTRTQVNQTISMQHVNLPQQHKPQTPPIIQQQVNQTILPQQQIQQYQQQVQQVNQIIQPQQQNQPLAIPVKLFKLPGFNNQILESLTYNVNSLFTGQIPTQDQIYTIYTSMSYLKRILFNLTH